MDKYGDCAASRDKLSTSVNQIDLWQVPLGKPDPRLPALFELLSPDEVLRARRFHFSKDRDGFTLVRASLRIVLGGYLDLNPARVEFRYGKAGKPCLPDSINPRGLRFNVSHSGGMALAAVAWGREVGVDVEQIRAGVNLQEVARQFFSQREVTELFDLPVEQQPAGFFNCWTRKEAYVKATGQGLSVPLHSFGVSLKPGEPARLTFIHDDAAEMRRWTLQDVSPAAGYAAALAVEGAGWELHLQDITGPASFRAVL